MPAASSEIETDPGSGARNYFFDEWFGADEGAISEKDGDETMCKQLLGRVS
jgi:hypothetical protein